MAQTSRFWESVTYSDDNFQEVINRLGMNGVLQGISGGLVVSAGTGMQVSVASGEAFVNGVWYQNSDAATLSIPASDSSNGRIDRIVIRKTASSNTCELVVVSGSPAASPVPPSLTMTSAVWEVGIADITVGAGVVSIAAGAIADARTFITQASGTDVFLTNKSGSPLYNGCVVIADSANANSFKTTTTVNDNQVIGVISDATIGTDGLGRIRTSGYAVVNVDAATTVGSFLYSSSTASKATPTGLPSRGVFARAMTSTSGAGKVLAILFQPIGAVGQELYAKNNSTVATSGNAEQTLLSFTLGANDLGTDRGIRITIIGVTTDPSTGNTQTLKVKFGSTAVITGNLTGMSSSTDNVKLEFTIFNTASNAQKTWYHYQGVSSALTVYQREGYGTAAVDTSSQQAVTVTWGANAGTGVFTKYIAFVEYLR